MNNFLNSGKKYDLLVNWEKRLSKEIPFLTDSFTDARREVEEILDVGCGTGRHAEALNEKGYKVTGIDKKEQMIEAAAFRAEGPVFVEGDILRTDLGKFDAIYSLGNSVGLAASEGGYPAVIEKFSKLIRKGGILVFQILNFEKERNGWSSPRTAETGDREMIFIRRFYTTRKAVHPEIVTLYRNKGEEKWDIQVSGPADIPRISSSDMKKLLLKNGFSDIKLFGSYGRTPFSSPDSVDMIWTAVLS